MDKFLERFSNFFVRSVAPSSIFFVLLFFNDMYFNESKIKDAVVNATKAEDKKETSKEISLNIKDLKISDDKEQIVITIDKPTISSDVKKTEKDKLKDTDAKSDANPNINLIYIFIALIFIAYGYVNQILTQIIDYSIKKNFCLISNKFFNICFDCEFEKVREDVKKKLENDNYYKEVYKLLDFNDSNAYEYLGKDETILPKNGHVDEAKNINTLMIGILINISIFYNKLEICHLWIFIVILIILYSLIKARYKARNKRLYINYLLKKEENKLEKETKILYKGGSR